MSECRAGSEQISRQLPIRCPVTFKIERLRGDVKTQLRVESTFKDEEALVGRAQEVMKPHQSIASSYVKVMGVMADVCESFPLEIQNVITAVSVYGELYVLVERSD